MQPPLLALLLLLPISTALPLLVGGEQQQQRFYIIRHADKYSSYPACPQGFPLCFNASLMGNNPPVTPCGVQQAQATAMWLTTASAKFGGIQQIVASPYVRSLETALPLARQLSVQLHVDNFVSEARNGDGPFRPDNLGLNVSTRARLADITSLWSPEYGSAPIPVPEDDTGYTTRVKRGAASLRQRWVGKGNVAIFTHATTSFSIAYGLCYGEMATDASLQHFVVGQDAIGPGGVITVVLDASGACVRVEQTQNNVGAPACGMTKSYKCAFVDFPSWYWQHSEGRGPGKCS